MRKKQKKFYKDSRIDLGRWVTVFLLLGFVILPFACCEYIRYLIWEEDQLKVFEGSEAKQRIEEDNILRFQVDASDFHYARQGASDRFVWIRFQISPENLSKILETRRFSEIELVENCMPLFSTLEDKDWWNPRDAQYYMGGRDIYDYTRILADTTQANHWTVYIEIYFPSGLVPDSGPEDLPPPSKC